MKGLQKRSCADVDNPNASHVVTTVGSHIVERESVRKLAGE